MTEEIANSELKETFGRIAKMSIEALEIGRGPNDYTARGGAAQYHLDKDNFSELIHGREFVKANENEGRFRGEFHVFESLMASKGAEKVYDQPPVRVKV